METGAVAEESGWGSSALFWLCLLVAAAMYGSVALAPKLLASLTLKREHYAQQVRLVDLERRVAYLDRVVEAMESEPEFAAQLARVDFDAARPGDERISVEPALSLDAREIAPSQATPASAATMLIPLLRQLTDRHELRRALLTISAALVIFAFAFLQDVPAEENEASDGTAGRLDGNQPGWGHWLSRRYRATAVRDARSHDG